MKCAAMLQSQCVSREDMLERYVHLDEMIIWCSDSVIFFFLSLKLLNLESAQTIHNCVFVWS